MSAYDSYEAEDEVRAKSTPAGCCYLKYLGLLRDF